MKKIILNITRRYLLALSILAFFSILSFFLYLKTKKATDQYGYLINMSGKQRFLSQRISFLASEFIHSPLNRDSIRQVLKHVADQMEKDHELLVHDSVSITSYYHSTTIDSIYFGAPLLLNKRVDTFLSITKQLVNLKNEELNQQNYFFSYILNESQGLLEGLDKIVAQYQKENDHAVRANYIRKINMVAGSLIAYTLIGLLIFLPMTKHIKNTLTDLNKKETEIQQINKEHVAAIIDAQEAEKYRVASELHDGLIQTLTILSYKLEQSQLNAPFPLPEYDETRSLVNDAISETRNIAYSIMPPILKEFGLKSAIKVLCKQISSQYKITIELNLFKSTERFDDRLELNLYRITQEALNNVVRHAQATIVKVQLIRHAASVVLIIEDNGCGFRIHKKKSGIGLINIKERTRMLKGEFHINSSAEMGTEVMVEIPLAQTLIENMNANGQDKNIYN